MSKPGRVVYLMTLTGPSNLMVPSVFHTYTDSKGAAAAGEP